MDNKSGNLFKGQVLATIFCISVVVLGIASWHRYFVTRDYDYIAETPCNPAMEQCLFRDCVNDPDSCPPNGLSVYKQYLISARDVTDCQDKFCLEKCENNPGVCRQLFCDSTYKLCKSPGGK